MFQTSRFRKTDAGKSEPSNKCRPYSAITGPSGFAHAQAVSQYS